MAGRFSSWLGRLGRMGRESLAILAAILAAFALDAWWEERREVEQMLDALDAVTLEVDRNIALLDEAIAHNRARAGYGFEIVRLTPEALAALPDDRIAELFQFTNYNLVRLQLGAVTAFIEGGYLAVVSDRNLRAELAGLPRIQEEIDEEMLAVVRAQEAMEAQMTVDLTVDEMLDSLINPQEAGRTLIRGVVTNEQARRALMFRSFFLGDLYTSELEEAKTLLEATRDHIERYTD